MGNGPNGARRVARPHHRPGEGEPEAAAARPHRPLPDPRLRPGDADRGDAAGARHPRAPRPRPLRRRVELGGVAGRQGARHRRAPASARRVDSLQAYYTIAGRDLERELVPDAAIRRRRADGLEPAGRRLAVRQVRPQQRGRGRRRGAPRSTSRRWTATGPTPSSTRCARSRRARRAASPRSRSPGCCTRRR